jgi:hypothetical protein
MADYYSIMVRAVRALDLNSGEARRRLYDRARAALLAEMRSAKLELLDIMAAQMSLEEAIGKIEADAQRDRRVELARDTPSTVSAAPSPPANQKDRLRGKVVTLG